jgi:prevent-host-death family protein
MRMGLREANQHFSKAIKAVKAGTEVVLTERGAPIAVITPLRQRARADDGLRALEASGRLRRATRKGPMPAFKPVRIKGEPLSETVRKDREPRF